MRLATILPGATLLLVLTACAPTTYITGSWKNTEAARQYNNIFIAALTGNTVAKSTTENDISETLAKFNIRSVKSIDVFPPKFQSDSLARGEILRKVQSLGSDAILSIAVLKKETESRYVRGGYDYAPASRYLYYGSFWGYYNYWYPYAYNPGYYTEEDVYYLETNLYDAENHNLIWSAQSRTYSYNGLAPVSKEFARTIVQRMRAEQVLR